MKSSAFAVVLSLSMILVVGLIWSGPVAAQLPDLSCSDIPEAILISPDGSLSYSVHIEECNFGVIVGSIVFIRFSPEADALIAWSPGQDHPEIQGITDSNGDVTFNIAGSGCVDFTRFASATLITQIKVDGIVFGEPMVVSPDAVNSAGLLPTELGTTICENGVTSVGLSDAVFHTQPIALGLVEPCSKFTGSPDDPVDLGDAVIVTPFISNSTTGACE